MLSRCYHSSQRATRGTLLASLKACSSSKDVESGIRLHSEAVAAGHDSDLHVATALVDMYANCGRLDEAMKVFEGMPRRDVVSWNALILGCVENGESEVALELFGRMKRTGCEPAARTYVAVLKAHAEMVSKEPWTEVEDGRFVKLRSLKQGKAIYSEAESQTNVFVATAMVDLCSKCGSMRHARRVFEGIRRPDVGLWNALILGYAENEENEVALELFSRMKLAPNTRTYVAVFKACINLAAAEEPRVVDGKLLKLSSLQTGIDLHAQVVKHGVESDVFVGNSLVDMYANCGDMVESRRVFDKMLQRTVVSWTALMAGYVENGEASLALEIFSRMRSSEAFQPDDRAVSVALLACAALSRDEAGRDVQGKVMKLKSLEMAKELHSQLSDWSGDVLSATTLIDAYASCGSMVDARRVFRQMINHDIVSWNSFMSGYLENNEPKVALKLFQRLKAEEQGCDPNAMTFTIVLAAIATVARHDQAAGAPIIDGKSVKTKWLETGMDVHCEAEMHKLSSELSVGAGLVDMYMACGSIPDACRVFFKCLPVHSVQLWSKMILGCVDNGEAQLALDELYYRMRVVEELTPGAPTLAALLKACASATDLQRGKGLHWEICRSGFSEGDDQVLESALIDMYCKCGSLMNAQQVFDSWRTGQRDSVCWNSLMSGYTNSGACSRVLEMLRRMQEEGVEVKGSTLVSVLAACSHGGLGETCKRLFGSMKSKFGVSPGVEHYNCMLDMLGRGNKLDEAVELARGMGELANAQSWRIVLAAARTWKNQRVGEVAFDQLLRIDPHHTEAASFVLMANIYATSAADAA